MKMRLSSVLFVSAVLFFACVTCFFDHSMNEAKLSTSAQRTRNVDAVACAPMTCVNSGGNCSSAGAQCIGNSQEVYNSTTEECSCEAPLAVGSPCVSSSQCPYQCVGHVCQSATYQSVKPGGICSVNSDCYWFNPVTGGSTTNCTNGRCTEGTLIGQSCEPENNFCVNSFCNQATLECTPYLNTGVYCSIQAYGINPCFIGSCSGSPSICVAPTLAAAGAACSTTGNGNLCNNGLYCGTDGVCHANSAINYAACSSNSNCTNGLTCLCNGNNGAGQCAVGEQTSNPSAILNAANSFYQCWFAFGCHQNPYPDQCTSCNSQQCQYAKAQLQYNSYDSNLIPSCLSSYYTSLTNSELAAITCPAPIPFPKPSSAEHGSTISGFLIAVMSFCFLLSIFS